MKKCTKIISVLLICCLLMPVCMLGGTKDEALKQFLELSETMFASDSKEP